MTNAVREEMVGSTRQGKADDLGPDLRWMLVEYRREGGGIIDAESFSAMAVDDDNLVM